jgi:tRNA threonylcarbamoyladenosine biosynthesis protein TsaE
MGKKTVREWKKVQQSDLPYIVYELKELAKAPALIMLEGAVGVGKTTFCQHFIGDGEVLSPTYSVMSEHKQILHADFYRLEKQEEVLQLEIPVYVEDKQWFFVEWGEKFSRRLLRELPESWSTYVLDITIPKGGEGESAPRNFIFSSFHED